MQGGVADPAEPQSAFNVSSRLTPVLARRLGGVSPFDGLRVLGDPALHP